MGLQRQDAWLEEEDVQLAQIVITHIEVGSTQLKAFEEAAKKLKRTAAACGFRWNAFLRKQYNEQIKQAKSMKNKPNAVETSELTDEYNYEYIAQQLKGMISTFDQLKMDNELLKKERIELKQSLVKIEKENEQLKTVKKEYLELLALIGKIRIDSNRLIEH